MRSKVVQAEDVFRVGLHLVLRSESLFNISVFYNIFYSIPVTGLRGLERSRRLRLPDFMTLGTPTHSPPLPPGIFWYSFLEVESTPGTWTCRMLRKKSPLRIDPGTFRLVAQRLNHYATPGVNSLYSDKVIHGNCMDKATQLIMRILYGSDANLHFILI